MVCNYLPLSDGTVAIICGGRKPKRCACGRSSEFQCDWKVGRGRTCNAHLCGEHALEVAPEKHLCPDHQAAYREWKARREERANAV